MIIYLTFGSLSYFGEKNSKLQITSERMISNTWVINLSYKLTMMNFLRSSRRKYHFSFVHVIDRQDKPFRFKKWAFSYIQFTMCLNERENECL